jgi:hypothetical protein
MILPSSSNIDAARSIYEKLKGWVKSRQLILAYFGSNPHNNDELVVVLKTLLINGLYYTNLKSPLSVVNHILNLDKADEKLKASDITVVDQIANFEKFNLVSFASKYAHFHNSSAFPLYDQYVWKALAYCWQSKPFKILNYQAFYKIIDAFRNLASLDDVSWADIDKYLWLLGIKKDLGKGKTGISKEVFQLYQTSEGRELFGALEPSITIDINK